MSGRLYKNKWNSTNNNFKKKWHMKDDDASVESYDDADGWLTIKRWRWWC